MVMDLAYIDYKFLRSLMHERSGERPQRVLFDLDGKNTGPSIKKRTVEEGARW